ncbi:hypothetical protein GCM10020295_56440 [Streptomyces cinereospinus]
MTISIDQLTAAPLRHSALRSTRFGSTIDRAPQYLVSRLVIQGDVLHSFGLLQPGQHSSQFDPHPYPPRVAAFRPPITNGGPLRSPHKQKVGTHQAATGVPVTVSQPGGAGEELRRAAC